MQAAAPLRIYRPGLACGALVQILCNKLETFTVCPIKKCDALKCKFLGNPQSQCLLQPPAAKLCLATRDAAYAKSLYFSRRFPHK